MAAALNDARPRQQQMNEAQAEHVERQLVGHPGRARGDAAQHREILAGKLVRRMRRKIARLGDPPGLARLIQNPSSPPAATRGWLETICSTRVVPERGMPTISSGVSSSRPNAALPAKKPGVKRRTSRSTSARNAAASKLAPPPLIRLALSKCRIAAA